MNAEQHLASLELVNNLQTLIRRDGDDIQTGHSNSDTQPKRDLTMSLSEKVLQDLSLKMLSRKDPDLNMPIEFHWNKVHA